jgi:hypothetical protein
MCGASKPDILPDWILWSVSMKKIFLAALTVLSLGAGVANAQSEAHSAPPYHQNGNTSN